MIPSSPWFVVYPARGVAQRRLVCFPFAGGGTSTFRLWPSELPEDIEVWAAQLPGRERRFGEPVVSDAAQAVGALVSALGPGLDMPYAFFGHSMGAVLAYETTRLLAALNRPLPALLAVSGRRAPHLPPRKAPIHDLPDDRFLAEIRAFEGTPQAVLDNAELMDLMLPALRADFRLVETYRPAPGPDCLDLPLWAVGGEDDHEAQPDQVAAWRAVSRDQFEHCTLPGGHFFLNTHRPALLAALTAVLERFVPRAG